MNKKYLYTKVLQLHAVSSGDKVFKTIGPRYAMIKWWSLSRSTLLNTPIVCLNVFFDSSSHAKEEAIENSNTVEERR